MKPRVQIAMGLSKSVLSVKDVHKKYNENKSNEVHVLKGIEFQIPYGQMVAVMGPSGCGKSTLLNLMGGLDNITSGDIKIDGEKIDNMDDNTLTTLRRDNIGFIFQLFNLFDEQTVFQNVSLPLLLQEVDYDEVIRRTEKMLHEVGLLSKINVKPNQLSGGEQQKVAIARTLITKPKIILADEPTGDLDMATSSDIMQLFRRMQKENDKMSIIIVTHSEWIAKQTDRIMQIKNGIIHKDERVK